MTEGEGIAIAQHLTGTAPQKLNGTVPKSETPESFSIDEYIRQQRDNAQALADAGNIEFTKTLLQGQIEGINQVVGLQNLLAEDFQNLIYQRIEELGKRGKERPNELIKDLGKKATTNQQSSQKTTTVSLIGGIIHVVNSRQTITKTDPKEQPKPGISNQKLTQPSEPPLVITKKPQKLIVIEEGIVY